MKMVIFSFLLVGFFLTTKVESNRIGEEHCEESMLKKNSTVEECIDCFEKVAMRSPLENDDPMLREGPYQCAFHFEKEEEIKNCYVYPDFRHINCIWRIWMEAKGERHYVNHLLEGVCEEDSLLNKDMVACKKCGMESMESGKEDWIGNKTFIDLEYQKTSAFFKACGYLYPKPEAFKACFETGPEPLECLIGALGSQSEDLEKRGNVREEIIL